MEHCCYPGCMRAQDSRGLCTSHYQLAYYHVKKGHTTWEKLIDEKLAKAVEPNYFLPHTPDN